MNPEARLTFLVNHESWFQDADKGRGLWIEIESPDKADQGWCSLTWTFTGHDRVLIDMRATSAGWRVLRHPALQELFSSTTTPGAQPPPPEDIVARLTELGAVDITPRQPAHEREAPVDVVKVLQGVLRRGGVASPRDRGALVTAIQQLSSPAEEP